MSRLNFNKLRHYYNSSLLIVGDVTTGSGATTVSSNKSKTILSFEFEAGDSVNPKLQPFYYLDYERFFAHLLRCV
jgi:hypothetical protein